VSLAPRIGNIQRAWRRVCQFERTDGREHAHREDGVHHPRRNRRTERSLITERVRAGLRNARAKGKRLGRPRITLDVARVVRLRAEGRTVREIADILGVSRSLVHKTLANRGPLDTAIKAR
jgi:hypothetical protein